MEQPIPGQRWVSDSEPELGLGMVIKQEFGRVHVHFPAANEQRQYALKSAPLRREVPFSRGPLFDLSPSGGISAAFDPIGASP
ncbi:MAG TPA: hypothetical protein VGO11_20965 [Chthoniobacteraceae bacterium]|jgi:ATP-dependent helicase HepA|nr:hypothetical protein [Chthoniobacteraceae bacterium]